MKPIFSSLRNRWVSLPLCIALAYALASWFWPNPIPSTPSNVMNNKTTLVTKSTTIPNRLTYQSQVQAKTLETLTSPTHGSIHKIHKHFGDSIKPGDIIIEIEATEIKDTLVDTALDLIRSKDKLRKLDKQVAYSKTMLKKGQVSLEEHSEVLSGWQDQWFTYLKLNNKLIKLCKTINYDAQAIANISPDNKSSVQKLLALEVFMTIRAKQAGILLAATQDTEDTKSPPLKKLIQGKPVEQGQILAIVGDPEKLELPILINDLDLKQLKIGYKATISNFSGLPSSIEGKTSHINPYYLVKTTQGHSGFQGIVSAHCPRSSCPLNIGSTVRVELNLPSHKGVIIPFSALSSEEPYQVKILSEGTWQSSPLVIEQTNAQGVVVTNMNEGQILALYYHNPPQP